MSGAVRSEPLRNAPGEIVIAQLGRPACPSDDDPSCVGDAGGGVQSVLRVSTGEQSCSFRQSTAPVP